MPAGILFVSHSAELNGAEQMLLVFLRALDRRAFSPHLVVPRSGPLLAEAEAAGVPAAVVPMKWWLTDRGRAWKQPLAWLWNLRGLFTLKRMVRDKGFVLVCSNSAAAVGGALAARLARVPHVWIVHEILSGKRPLLSFLLGNRIFVGLIRRLSRTVVVNSLASRQAFAEAKGRVEVVYNGVSPPPKIEKGSADSRLRQRLNLRKGDRVVGVVGKVAPEKGQRMLIRALGLACRRMNAKNLKLLIVGAVSDERYGASLRREVRQQGLEGRVIFAGFVDDIFSALRMMDVLASASRVESFGRTVIEAMAAGVPVLAVRTGGIPEIIRHGRNGFLVDSDSPEVLAGALVEFFALKKKDVAALVRSGQREVARRFGAETQVRKLERILRDVLKEPQDIG